MVQSEPTAAPESTHFLFFTYRDQGRGDRDGERGRRNRASEIVQSLGGTCEIFRISWNGFDMVSIVRRLSTEQVMQLADQINSWGAVQTTVVPTSDAGIRKG